MKTFIEAVPGTLVKSRLVPGLKPAATVQSGDTVVLETLSAISIGEKSFLTYCEKYGLDVNDPMLHKIYVAMHEVEPKGRNSHMLTGPIYVDGAEVGDVIEVRILDMELTVPFGNISASPGSGGLPELVMEQTAHRVEYDETRHFGKLLDMDIPLDPFFGVMGLVPEEDVSSSPPGRFGGNMDLKYLTKGTSAFFPVLVPGGQFFAGDAHAAQGNGEVCITAIETAGLTGTLQFILHKKWDLKWPMAETPTHYIICGLDKDLNLAMREALKEAVWFLQQKKNISFNDAIILLSAAGDFEVTQVVDGVKGIHCMIDKKIFRLENPEFWNADGSVRY